MPISVEWRIASTAGSPVVGRFAVAADENLYPRRFWVRHTSPVIWRADFGRTAASHAPDVGFNRGVT
jgi:hypothetical protein